MTNNRSAANFDERDVALAGNSWTRFWLTPTSTIGLQCLRVLSGLLLCAWLLSFLGHQAELFSLNGWLDAKAYETMQRPLEPGQEDSGRAPIGWSILYLAGTSPAAFQAMYFGSIAVLGLFTLGIATRITGVLTWVIVVSFLANPATSYEGDYLLGILAFYLMLGHLFVGQWDGDLSMAERILGSRRDFLFAAWLFPTVEERPASHAVNWMMRMVQIHFLIILTTSVLHKLQMSDWWAGVALWYPMHSPLKTTMESLRQEAPQATTTLFFLSLAQYLVLAWQLGFALFAWRSGWWRVVLLGGAFIGWVGSFFLFKQPLFGPFVFLCCLSYLRPEEWAWSLARLQSVWRSAAKENAGTESKKVAVTMGKENIKK